MNKTTIAIIIPWFGPWPTWMDLFIHSSQCNKTIDFILFSDQELPAYAQNIKNIHFEKIAFKDYCSLVSQSLDIEFHPANPYKLCDLKPYYGFIHHEIIKNYNFWGFGDLDLVWGDIRHFYTEQLLKKHDILSTHSDRLSGHLTFVRNIPYYNTLALRLPNWKELLTSPDNQAIDEIHLTLKIYPWAKLLWKIHKHIFLRFHFQDEWSAYNRFCRRVNRILLNKKILFVERNTSPWNDGDMPQKEWLYKNGHVYDTQTKEELIYLHFLSMKKQWVGNYYHPSSNGSVISFTGFQPYEEV